MVAFKKHSDLLNREGDQRKPRMDPYLDGHLSDLETIVHFDS
jgi:hypothetical protein